MWFSEGLNKAPSISRAICAGVLLMGLLGGDAKGAESSNVLTLFPAPGDVASLSKQSGSPEELSHKLGNLCETGKLLARELAFYGIDVRVTELCDQGRFAIAREAEGPRLMLFSNSPAPQVLPSLDMVSSSVTLTALIEEARTVAGDHESHHIPTATATGYGVHLRDAEAQAHGAASRLLAARLVSVLPHSHRQLPPLASSDSASRLIHLRQAGYVFEVEGFFKYLQTLGQVEVVAARQSEVTFRIRAAEPKEDGSHPHALAALVDTLQEARLDGFRILVEESNPETPGGDIVVVVRSGRRGS